MSEILQYNRNGLLSNKLEEDVVSEGQRNAQEGGWEFWNRVYTNPELRTMMDEKLQNETSMSELLQSSTLCRAEVVVVNVPRLSASQHALVRTMIQKELCTNVPILEVEILPRKWVIRFYRREDAMRVQHVIEGHAFRGRLLHASLADIIQAIPTNNVPIPMEINMSMIENRNPNWGTAEWNDILAFKGDIISMLSRAPQGLAIGDTLGELRLMRRRGVVSSALELWPTGLIRMFAPKVKMTGRYLSLSDQNNLSSLMRKAASEGTARAILEHWEPIASGEIRSDVHFIDYLIAMLSNFGPQHIDIDLPIRILASTMTAQWPNISRDLAKKAISMSPHFTIMDDILYLATNVRHRRLLLEHVQPTSVMVKSKNFQRPFGRV